MGCILSSSSSSSTRKRHTHKYNNNNNSTRSSSSSPSSSSSRRGIISNNNTQTHHQVVGVGGSGSTSTSNNNNHNTNQEASPSPSPSPTSMSISSSSAARHRYSFIPDNYSSLDQVTAALREAGLESSNLILAIDFTKSNEWTGKLSFHRRSLHAIGDTPNPYETAISIIGKTLAPFDEDNLIPCFGFGDATTHDQEVFSFHTDNSACLGFGEVLSCYRNIVPSLRLSGPTSFAPAVEAAIDIIEKSGGQYHVLVIVADGQVTRSTNASSGELSPQEEQTIKSIVNASSYPLSIILVGVGDGPWEDMKKFDDKIPARDFDNFQFVNFTAIMTKNVTLSEKETAFALAALMEIPLQYQAAVEFNLIGRTTGRAKQIMPKPPPVLNTTRRPLPSREPSNVSGRIADESNQACPICLTNPKNMAFGCGHMTCRDCGTRLSSCPICRQPITNRIRLFG